MAQPVAKVRSRKDGSAVPLDELDRKLLNLLQGSFPLAARPYAHVAELAGDPGGRGSGANQAAARRAHHPRDHADLRHARARLQLDAGGGEGGPENPWRAAKIINSHPGVSHNYLRDHDFNLWFTIATEPDSQLGLEGTLEVLERLTGAESVRQLPTLRLFKIRMDLEMEEGTETLAAAAAEARRLRGARGDRAVRARLRGDPRHQGPMEVVPEPYAAAAAELGITQEALLEHLESMRERRALRRVAAILFHRRAGFSANGMGVWRVPEERILELGPRMAAFRGISHCYQRPTYADWPYSVFTMAHGRSKEECDAILDSIAEDTGIEDRRTLYSSTEFKKIRLLYFTDEHGGGRRSTRSALTRDPAAAYARAVQLLPGGVNSPVRAMRSIGRDPIFVASRRGRRAGRRGRQPLRGLGHVLGPADRGPRASGGGGGGDAPRPPRARASARPPRPRWSWRPRWSSACPRRRWCA